jgi:hypothetical protein
MSDPAYCGYSLVCLTCALPAFFAEPDRSFARQNPREDLTKMADDLLNETSVQKPRKHPPQ